MVRIYVVDNGGQWTHREWRVLKYLGADSKIVPFDTPWKDLEAAKVDGLVLSGGAPRVGLADSLGNCGDYLTHLKAPILGICAGHQFMARHYGGAASPGVGEFGATKLTLHNGASEHPLLREVPKESIVWESHHDDVSQVPKDFEVLASSERCQVQAMAHRSLPRYGLQFHPEVEHSEYGGTMFRNFVQICQERSG